MEYEDELERMRTRSASRKNSGSPSANRNSYREAPPRGGGQRRGAGGRSKKAELAARRRKRKRRILVLELLILAAVLAGAYFFLHSPDKDRDGYWNVAVFGVDSRDGALGKGAHSDVIMLASLDRSTGKVKLVSIFRDTYLKINQKGTYHKINEAYFKDGPEGAVKALEENLDLNIDDYVTFNWKAVVDSINILGGVDIEITDKEFGYINSFITETVNSTGIGSHQLKSAGMQHLDGVQAVAYSRLRLMDTDFQRTERQRKVVSLAMEKAKSADFAVLNNILVSVLPQLKTSVGAADLLPLAKDIKSYHLGETAGFPFARGTKKIGKMDCVIPQTLESNVVQLHQFLFGEDVEYSPSGAVKKISARIAKDSGMTEAGKNASSKGNSGSGGSTSTAPAPETTAPLETTEEETVEETEESTEAVKETEETKPTKENGELIGPGATEAEKPSAKPESETDSGPGVESLKEPSEQTLQTKPQSSEPSPDASPEDIGPGTSEGKQFSDTL